MISNDVINLFHSTVADAVEEELILKLNRQVWLNACRTAIEEQKEDLKLGIESEIPKALELTDAELLEAMEEILVDYEPFCTRDANDLIASDENYNVYLERRDRKMGPFVRWVG